MHKISGAPVQMVSISHDFFLKPDATSTLRILVLGAKVGKW